MKNHPILIPALLFAACSGERANTPVDTAPATEPTPVHAAAEIEHARAEYDMAAHFPGTLKDTLLADMITYIHKRPESAIGRDRSDPAFRRYYVDKLPLYRPVYHHQEADSTHWFYLIRPARSAAGSERGVGGRFRTNAAFQLVEFEELFNTPVLPEAELLDKGLTLFEEMMATGHVDALLDDRTYIEWPDGRLHYDRALHEWRY